MSSRSVSVHKERWPLKSPFRITGKLWNALECVVVEIEEFGRVGRGEAAGVYYLDESAEAIFDQVGTIRDDLERGMSREELLLALPPGGARNAIDCALWDLEAEAGNSSVWTMTETPCNPVQTVMTVSIRDSIDEMARDAARFREFPVLKVKLDGEQPVERMAAIRTARPDASIIIDANQGFTFEILKEVLPEFKKLNIAMVEQPLPRGEDDCLEGFPSPVPLCADESCLHSGELELVSTRYQMFNIKLDKCGGLTAALDMLDEGKALGMGTMVGNMFGTSLAMMPAFVVAQKCKFVDIDGPLHLQDDRVGALDYERGVVSMPEEPLWGGVPGK